MTTQTEALKLALEALYFLPALSPAQNELQDGAIEAIKEALAQQEQEPVACTSLCVECTKRGDWVCAKAIPPQRTWVGLDPEEIRKTNHHMVDGAYHYSFKQGAEWAEAKLKEKNT